MKIYVVRHAHAGSRSQWSGDDRLRPLSKKGRRQAETIATILSACGITRLVSSPSIRCIETLRPLADRTGLGIDGDDRLAEGSDGEAALELADELRKAGTVAALCSHGDVIPELLWCLKGSGTAFPQGITWPKASIWEIAGNDTRWTDASCLFDPKA